jgi:hypothetical protein
MNTLEIRPAGQTESGSCADNGAATQQRKPAIAKQREGGRRRCGKL